MLNLNLNTSVRNVELEEQKPFTTIAFKKEALKAKRNYFL